jgi:hypothetical protein
MASAVSDAVHQGAGPFRVTVDGLGWLFDFSVASSSGHADALWQAAFSRVFITNASIRGTLLVERIACSAVQTAPSNHSFQITVGAPAGKQTLEQIFAAVIAEESTRVIRRNT